MDKRALGFIELPNLCDAIEALDVMLKTAAVSLVTWEKKLGGRLVTIIVSGEVSAVEAAVEGAKSLASGKIKSSLVIAAPHSETLRIAQISAKKWGIK